jgi:hypothetical protein
MLKGISWTCYFQTILRTGVFYYAVVIAVYFRKDVKRHWSKLAEGRLLRGVRNQPDFVNGSVRPSQGPSKVMEELRLLFLSAREQRFQKEEIFMALELQLKGKIGSGAESANVIMKFIVSQLESICHIKVEERDIEYMFRS